MEPGRVLHGEHSKSPNPFQVVVGDWEQWNTRVTFSSARDYLLFTYISKYLTSLAGVGGGGETG